MRGDIGVRHPGRGTDIPGRRLLGSKHDIEEREIGGKIPFTVFRIGRMMEAVLLGSEKIGANIPSESRILG
jgi:hypothetical protein